MSSSANPAPKDAEAIAKDLVETLDDDLRGVEKYFDNLIGQLSKTLTDYGDRRSAELDGIYGHLATKGSDISEDERGRIEKIGATLRCVQAVDYELGGYGKYKIEDFAIVLQNLRQDIKTKLQNGLGLQIIGLTQDLDIKNLGRGQNEGNVRKLEQLVRGLRQENERLGVYEGEYKDIQAKSKAVEMTRAAIFDRIGVSVAENDALQKKLEDLESECHGLKRAEEKSQAYISHLEGEMVKLNERIDDINVAAEKRQVTHLRKALATAETQIQQDSKHFEDLIAREKTRSADELKKAKHELSETRLAIKEKDQELRGLMSSLSIISNEKDAVKQELADTTKQLQREIQFNLALETETPADACVAPEINTSQGSLDSLSSRHLSPVFRGSRKNLPSEQQAAYDKIMELSQQIGNMQADLIIRDVQGEPVDSISTEIGGLEQRQREHIREIDETTKDEVAARSQLVEHLVVVRSETRLMRKVFSTLRKTCFEESKLKGKAYIMWPPDLEEDSNLALQSRMWYDHLEEAQTYCGKADECFKRWLGRTNLLLMAEDNKQLLAETYRAMTDYHKALGEHELIIGTLDQSVRLLGEGEPPSDSFTEADFALGVGSKVRRFMKERKDAEGILWEEAYKQLEREILRGEWGAEGGKGMSEEEEWNLKALLAQQLAQIEDLKTEYHDMSLNHSDARKTMVMAWKYVKPIYDNWTQKRGHVDDPELAEALDNFVDSAWKFGVDKPSSGAGNLTEITGGDDTTAALGGPLGRCQTTFHDLLMNEIFLPWFFIAQWGCDLLWRLCLHYLLLSLRYARDTLASRQPSRFGDWAPSRNGNGNGNGSNPKPARLKVRQPSPRSCFRALMHVFVFLAFSSWHATNQERGLWAAANGTVKAAMVRSLDLERGDFEEWWVRGVDRRYVLGPKEFFMLKRLLRWAGLAV